ncbi:MAG: hypothetical protein QY304_01570 [Candidatus Paceibacterota bacterium]|nr:MAG: hypothetical protein QY304_01570 [Candidatus Paceibacterota bacterium]
MDIYLILRILHLLGFAIGIGGATASDALFFRSLKDKKITDDELNLLKTLSRLMWAGISILVISGAGFLIYSHVTTGSIPLLSNPRFLAKLTIVGVIITNGVVFHSIILPFLSKSVGKKLNKKSLGNKFMLLVSAGGISIASWYSTFIFAMLKQFSMPYFVWINIYVLAVLLAITGGYFVFSFKLKNKNEQKKANAKNINPNPPNSGNKNKTEKIIFSALVLLVILSAVLITKPFATSDKNYYVCIDEIPPWFHPEVLEIKKGDTVIWKHCKNTNKSENDRHLRNTLESIFLKKINAHEENGGDNYKHIHTHPILAISGPEIFSSGFRPIGHIEDKNEFSFKFTKEGIYEYLCPTHPYMKGIIAVGEKSPVESLWPPKEKLDQNLMVLPKTPGIGEIWVDTQFEIVPGQRHPGTITVIDAETWEIKNIIKDHDFNNPHNLWNTPDNKFIFQTQWHHNIVTKIDAETKEVLKNLPLGNAPAHVFVHPKKERVYWTINNETQIIITDYELNVLEEIPTSFGPHGVWIDPSGKWMSVAATLAEEINIIDLEKEEIVATFEAPGLPLATQITNDGKYAMVSLLLENKVRFIDLEKMEIVKDVEVGTFPIWAIPEPTGKYVFVANTGTADISIISLERFEVEKTIPAAAGAHGIIFGKKSGGGYYGYFSNKFARAVGIIDLDTLETVGFIPLGENQWGGNGILVIPNPYDEISF